MLDGGSGPLVVVRAIADRVCGVASRTTNGTHESEKKTTVAKKKKRRDVDDVSCQIH